MIDFSVLFPTYQVKTRVLIASNNAEVARCIFHTLEFYQKNFDYLLENGSNKNSGEDFIFLESNSVEIATQFKPNIVLLTSEIVEDNVGEIAKNITGGGVLVYPEKFENLLDHVQNYFRKLPYSPTDFSVKNNTLSVSTEMGEIALQTLDQKLALDLQGIQFFNQQFGIMEEDFYDPLLNFQ
ncbi:hypothetical protein [Chryseobacterium sp. MP_3.2]|uniref:hypothetical protein n=1 Tax=Chryseobacterium sp. MP_3.2 TaxID=3071712 RepID=UPI002DF9B08B|nr:hypothetical protein [Chryseobacterium sp. MP_3.2]